MAAESLWRAQAKLNIRHPVKLTLELILYDTLCTKVVVVQALHF
jgi:hypothetical protein